MPLYNIWKFVRKGWAVSIEVSSNVERLLFNINKFIPSEQFTTTPEEVYAGDTFKLTLNLKNTSKETAVSNMLFDIQGTQEGTDANNTYAAFLPTAGSSTIFVEKIAPNATKSISIELKSKADLAQKPYVVTVNMEYEDSKANSFTKELENIRSIE